MSGLRLCHQGHSNALSSRYCHQCGAPLLDANDLMEKVVGDRYRIVRDIGHGGFGQTYLAQDINRFNEHCVLKELAPAAENQDSLEKAKELFAREAEVLYKLQHPQIPKFREWFTEPKRQSMFLVQDYAEGPTYQDILRDRQRQNHTFAESEIVTLLIQLLPVLSYIHGRGVVHRDLSPDNLICRNSDRLPVLIDFGGVKEVAVSAVKMQSKASANSANKAKDSITLIGKPGYSPEEQMRRGQVSAASDLYALGVTALVLLIGKDPAEFYDAFHLAFDWHDKVKVSPGLAAILDKMIAHRVGDRYSTAQEVFRDIAALSQKPSDWVAAPQQQWTSAQDAPGSGLQTVGSFKTLVVAPLGTAFATAAAVPMELEPRPSSSHLAKAARGVSGWVLKQMTGLARALLLLVLLLGAGGLGWAAVSWWIQSQMSPSAPTPSASSPPAPSTQAYSATEQQRKAQMINRLEGLGVSSRFFNRLVNEAYYLQYPDQRGRLLSNGPEDESLRTNWDQVGSQVLDAIEPLRPAARDRLGSYTEGDRASWVTQLNAAGQDSGQFFQRVESQLTDALPMYRGVDLQGKVAALQLMSGIAADQMVEASQQ